MKPILLLFISAVSLWACNNSTPPHAHHAAAIDSPMVTAGTGQSNIFLSENGKWKADASTNKNVAALQQTASALNKQPFIEAADYHRAATKLQSGLAQLVKECTMKGAAHDALHLWLEPLLAEVKSLKNVANNNEGERLFHSIRTRLLDYNLYFE